MCWRGDTGASRDELWRLRQEVSRHLVGVAHLETDEAGILIGELLANVRAYAPGPFCVEVHHVREECRVSFHDSGPCFAATAIPPAPEMTKLTEHGRGLPIVEAIGGRIHTARREHGGCRVTVLIDRRDPDADAPSVRDCPHGHPALRGDL